MRNENYDQKTVTSFVDFFLRSALFEITKHTLFRVRGLLPQDEQKLFDEEIAGVLEHTKHLISNQYDQMWDTTTADLGKVARVLTGAVRDDSWGQIEEIIDASIKDLLSYLAGENE